jgi:hypothetical protein
MDGSWTAYALDAERSAEVWHHPAASPLQMVDGSAASNSPAPVDLSPYATGVRQSADQAEIQVSWHHQLDGAAQPAPGEMVELKLDGQSLWWGVIDSINDYRVERGTRSLSITARTRDASPMWRNVSRVTDVYPTATPLAVIARDVAESLGLTAAEILLPAASAYTIHSNTQLADLSAWDMLETLYLPGGYAPFVDARGRLKVISRDIARPPDVALTEDRIVSVNGARARSPVTAVRVKWLDPALTYVAQQDQTLASATITAGFFVPKIEQDVHFSADGSQRASGTVLVVKQSANAGLLPVCTEDYEQLSLTQGKITLTNTYFAAGLATVSLAGLLAASKIPDGVYFGYTIPVGKVVHGIAEVGILVAMMSIGTGVYEIHGTPYDYVHARNISEAYDCDAPEWLQNVQEIENDFVMSEDAAQGLAVRELLYRARAASTYSLTIVDDPRIEPGDIIELPDESRVYVTGYTRNLSRGSAATLDIDGFRAV